MILTDTALISFSVRALHAPRTPIARTKPAYPTSNFVRSFMPSSAQRVVDGGRRVAADRNDLYRGVSHLAEEAVHDRSVNKEVPTRARGRAEDDVGDPFPLREVDEDVGYA